MRRRAELGNPFGVTAELEGLAEPTEVPFYSESMFFQAWDHERNVGVWAHAGVVTEDNRLWQSQTVVYLPGGMLLVERSSGRSPDRRGPSAGSLSMVSDEPLRRWHVAFDGMAERTTTEAAAAGLVGAGLSEPVWFELSFEAACPVWDMYASLGHPGTDWGQLHHEQAFTVSGELRVGGAVQHFEGIGYRDHGRGTRDVTRLGGDTMVFGVFPDGRSVGSLLAWTRDGTSVVNAGYLHDEDGFHPLSVERLPALVDPRGDPAMFRVLLALHDGTAVEIGVEILHSATLSIVEPNRWMIGADLAAEDPLLLVESPARLVIGDTMGYGNVERNCRRSRLGAAIFEQG